MPGALPPPFDDFGNRLEEAARRQIEDERIAASRRRARRRRKALLGTLAAVFVPAAALAGVSSVLDDPGRPLSLPAQDVPADAAPATDPTVVATSAVPDPDGGLPWAVRVFGNPAGEQCVGVGRLRLGRLGRVRGREFRPLPTNAPGVCGDVEADGLVYAIERRAQPVARTVVFGLSDGRGPIVFQAGGRERTIRARALGTFLLVFKGVQRLSGASLEFPLDGRRVRRQLG